MKIREDCLFCQMGRGEIPCAKVYEDAEILAFLDINPASRGHTLVITKEHFDSFAMVPQDLLGKAFAVAQRIAQAQLSELGARGVNIISNVNEAAGQSVMHFHIHVIPRFDPNDGLRLNFIPAKLENYNLPAVASEIKRGLR